MVFLPFAIFAETKCQTRNITRKIIPLPTAQVNVMFEYFTGSMVERGIFAPRLPSVNSVSAGIVVTTTAMIHQRIPFRPELFCEA